MVINTTNELNNQENGENLIVSTQDLRKNALESLEKEPIMI